MFQTRTEPGRHEKYLQQPASPKEAGKGHCREGRCLCVMVYPSVVGVGLLGVQGPGTRSARERDLAGDWRPCCPFSARGRCSHGPGPKKFRLQRLAVQGDDAHSDNPSPWLPTVSSCSPATATPSWRALSRTGMFMPFSSIYRPSSWRGCTRGLEAFISVSKLCTTGLQCHWPVSLKLQSLRRALGWHSKFDRLRLRLTQYIGWE